MSSYPVLIKLLACIGLVWIIKDSYILSRPREWVTDRSKHLKEFLSCSLCIGFWVGLGLSFLEFYISHFSYNLLLIPFAISAFCWFFDSLLDLIQEAYVFLKNIREKK